MGEREREERERNNGENGTKNHPRDCGSLARLQRFHVSTHLPALVFPNLTLQALGCLLYKLSFFEDAFGETPLAVMSVKYSIPSEHKFSDGLVDLIRPSTPAAFPYFLPSCDTTWRSSHQNVFCFPMHRRGHL